MSIAEGSLVRLAHIPEVTIGTIPATPAWQIARWVSADFGPSKQTETPDEVRPDGNGVAPVDVGQTTGGNINCLLSYGTFDDWLASLFRQAWATNVLVNGTADRALAFEEFYEQGATDTFIRHPGCRINTLDITLEAKKSVQANFGIMGLETLAPASAIIAGATYVAATETEVFNSALNVADLEISGITNSPVIQRMNLRISSNVYDNDAVGRRGTYQHGKGKFVVSGSILAYFETQDTYEAARAHTTVGLSWSLGDAAGNSYLFEIPKNKLMDGKVTKPGNGRAVMVDAPFQGFVDAGIGGTMKITRTPA